MYQRSKLKQTASALNGSPSWNVTPSCRVNVYAWPLSETSQSVARPGTTSVPPGARVTSPSNIWSMARSDSPSDTNAPSRMTGSADVPNTMVSVASPPAACSLPPASLPPASLPPASLPPASLPPASLLVPLGEPPQAAATMASTAITANQRSRLNLLSGRIRFLLLDLAGGSSRTPAEPGWPPLHKYRKRSGCGYPLDGAEV